MLHDGSLVSSEARRKLLGARSWGGALAGASVVPVRLNGAAGAIIVVGGRPFVVMGFIAARGRISRSTPSRIPTASPGSLPQPCAPIVNDRDKAGPSIRRRVHTHGEDGRGRATCREARHKQGKDEPLDPLDHPTLTACIATRRSPQSSGRLRFSCIGRSQLEEWMASSFGDVLLRRVIDADPQPPQDTDGWSEGWS